MITFFFKTYGCQANVADSDRLATFLRGHDCSEVATEQEADLVIVNTCAVREKAEQKLFSYIGELSDIKRTKPYMKIGIIGCVASYKKDEIYRRFDLVNFVYGAKDDFETLEAYLRDLVTGLETTKQLYTGIIEKSDFPVKLAPLSGGQDRDIKKLVAQRGLFGKPLVRSSGLLKKAEQPAKPFSKKMLELQRSYINIMTGCNKFCAYCIVPFTRGREVSYAMDQIVDRVAHDVANGAREVTLVGQNVNSYRDAATGKDFSELLRRVAALEGKFWVRWISPHPQDMTEELFDVIAAHQDRIPAYVHFPMQAGSNRVLELMKRNYSIERFEEQIGWLRSRMPDATISTDIIVGFPGEHEEDYEQTVAAVGRINFDWIYSFNYSPRKHTFASRSMVDDVPAEVKSARLEKLQKRQLDISCERYARHVGREYEVLVEKRLEDGRLLARTPGNARVLFSGGDELIGDFARVRIDQTGPVNMHATLVGA